MTWNQKFDWYPNKRGKDYFTFSTKQTNSLKPTRNFEEYVSETTRQEMFNFSPNITETVPLCGKFVFN